MNSFSGITLGALAHVITGGAWNDPTPPIGKYRSAYYLEQFFENIVVDFQVAGQSRVPAVKECLRQLNETEPEKVVAAIEAVSDPRDYLDEPEKLNAVVEYMNRRLKFDGYDLRKQGEFYRLVSCATDTVAASSLRTALEEMDYESVSQDFKRALEAAENDPADAITAACSTVESVCKCILDDMGKPYPNKQDIKGLVNEVAMHLNLSPARTDLHSQWKQDIKQILGGLISVASGVGALRTHCGDAHGRGKRQVPVDARIARLTIHAASTISLFYIETWDRVKQMR